MSVAALRPPVESLRAAIAAACAPRWRLEGWDTEQGISFLLVRGPGRVLVELTRRVEGRACYARTSRFDVFARRVPGDDGELSAPERAIVARALAALARAEERLPRFERPTTSKRAEVREIASERVLVPEGGGQYYLNPYVGCMIGCPFCYVAERADLSRELAGLPGLPWGRWAQVKVDAPRVLRRELPRHTPGPVRMSPILTDPYQPLERRHRISRGCLEALSEVEGFAPVILTRAPRVLEDRDLLLRFPRAAVGLSIPTDDDAVRRRAEPGADPIEERIDALEALSAAGLVTFAAIQPILPMQNPEALAERISPFVRRVRIDRLHGRYPLDPELAAASDPGWSAEMEARLAEAFARRGVRLDPLDDMRALLADAP